MLGQSPPSLSAPAGPTGKVHATRPGWRARLTRLAWASLFLTLPVTSFPYLPDELGGRTLVRPLAALPLLALVVFVTLPRLWRKPLPRTFLPLMAFVLAAMLGSILAFTSDLDAYRGVSLAARFLRNLVTLGLGLAFYVTVALLHESWADIRFSLRWLLAGFGVALAWGSLQIPYVVFFQGWYFKAFTRLQGLVSSRKLFTTRISGMTYEPKWFAEQIVFLLLPWLLAYNLKRRSLFTWRLRLRGWEITLENLMLPWAVGVLFFTFSRTGLFILALLAVVSFWVYRRSAHARPGHSPAGESAAGMGRGVTAWGEDDRAPSEAASQNRPARQGGAPLDAAAVRAPVSDPASAPQVIDGGQPGQAAPAPAEPAPPLGLRPAPPLRRRALESAAIVAGVLVVLFVVGSQNAYFSRMWRYWSDGKARNRTYLQYIAFEQRFVYWTTAVRTYADQPLVGVGLGNYAFYFSENLPDQPYETQKEIMRQVTPAEGRDRLITPKNLYARLLAETGLLGVGLFTTFLLAVIGCLLYLAYSPGEEAAVFALGGALAMVVFALVIFSFDSFALPNMWVVFGLITAAAHLPDRDDMQ